VVEHEVVEYDDARPPPQRLDDPAVRVRVVADVVEADVRVGRRRAAVRGTTSTSIRRRSAGSSSSLYSEIPVRSGGRGEK
jgi:hypothetical protein